MRCGHFPMFRGPVGQKQDSIAVRIEKYIQPKEQEDD
jgi:flagellar motor switch protein FliM